LRGKEVAVGLFDAREEAKRFAESEVDGVRQVIGCWMREEELEMPTDRFGELAVGSPAPRWYVSPEEYRTLADQG
jgi:hypothetical protein